MSTDEHTQVLRSEIAAHLVSLEALVMVRGRLLQRAVQAPSALVAAALRQNRATAESVRKASRRARAHLVEVEARQTHALAAVQRDVPLDYRAAPRCAPTPRLSSIR